MASAGRARRARRRRRRPCSRIPAAAPATRGSSSRRGPAAWRVLGDLAADVVREARLRGLRLRRHAEPEREPATGILQAAASLPCSGSWRPSCPYLFMSLMQRCWSLRLRSGAPRDGERKQPASAPSREPTRASPSLDRARLRRRLRGLRASRENRRSDRYPFRRPLPPSDMPGSLPRRLLAQRTLRVMHRCPVDAASHEGVCVVQPAGVDVALELLRACDRRRGARRPTPPGARPSPRRRRRATRVRAPRAARRRRPAARSPRPAPTRAPAAGWRRCRPTTRPRAAAGCAR